MLLRVAILLISLCELTFVSAQSPLLPVSVLPAVDSGVAKISQLDSRYVQVIAKKANTYYNAVTEKTLKTLERLAKWEAKIKIILEKTSPETAQRLFGEGQLTFAVMLQKYKEGKVAMDNYRGQYNEYRDKVNTTLKYLDSQKEEIKNSVIQPLQEAKVKTDKLNGQLKNTEAVHEFIKSRKKALLQEAIKYIGKTKYLQKISKESFYYGQALQNLDEVFNTPGKAEQMAVHLLKTIPAFNTFLKNNSALASLFRSPDASAGAATLAGLQTRTQVNSLIQQQIAAGGPNAREVFNQNMNVAQTQLSELKNKIIKAGGNSSNDEQPEGFKKNELRGKSLKKKVELSLNLQTNKGSSVLPIASDLGISAGFRPHQNFVAGLGLAGRIGWGKDIRHISLSYSGISARSFAEYKIRGSVHFAAGFELNYRPEIRNLEILKDYSAWQRSLLVGLSKTVSLKTKLFKKTSLKLLWDAFSYKSVPKQPAVVFRVSYNLK